jgi:phenylalanyl-tRNA synthetase beta chain
LLISLNWIRDFVDLPADVNPRELAERFTVTTAEVEGVEHVTCDARGLIAAAVVSAESLPGEKPLYRVMLDIGGREVSTVTVAEGLRSGDRVIYAPVGATLPGVGVVEEKTLVASQAGGVTARSMGMIVPGDALGLHTIGQRAIWLRPETVAGMPIDMDLFDDWIIEIDNKSITHRPDLWGHYGVAREVAAMLELPLKPYPVTPIEELLRDDLSEVPIVIDDPSKCPRYSALRFTGVRPQPAPLWMQVWLAHVGLRPIDILVDLTNYIMAELGQPMHAFDAAGIDRIEFAVAGQGERFTTLDGVERAMPPGTLMIQSNRRSVAIAGIMGGADTEVMPKTTDLLLESANFEPATIRRAAAAMGHRTDASARFEKSLDPEHTVLGIQRFVHLARPELPAMRPTSRLSDAFPNPQQPTVVRIDPDFVQRYVGRKISPDRIEKILAALEFQVRRVDGKFDVTVPSFRATRDISIEADVVEEVARFVGYGSIDPVLPVVTVRDIPPDAMGRLARRTLALLCRGRSYAEVHRYIWFDDNWLRLLDYDPGPTIRLRNPAAAGQERLRTTLVPGLLAAINLNRRHLDRFELVEIGSVFRPVCVRTRTGRPGDRRDPESPVEESDRGSMKGAIRSSESAIRNPQCAAEDAERRHMCLAMVVPGRKPAQEDELIRRLKSDLETWAFQTLGAELGYGAAQPIGPWEHEARTARVLVRGGDRRNEADLDIGRLTVVPVGCRRRIDEHLAAWTIALAEVNLSAIVDLPHAGKKLVPVPVYPQTDVDFSVLAEAARPYADLESGLAGYHHPLLRRLAFVDSYEGGSVPAGQRSFTFRATIGDPSRTLTDQDIQDFRAHFIDFLTAQRLTLRS